MRPSDLARIAPPVEADRRQAGVAAVGSGDHEHVDVVGPGVAASRSGPADGLLVRRPDAGGKLGAQRLSAGEVEGDAGMIKEMPTHAGQIRGRGDAQCGSSLAGPTPERSSRAGEW